ncbi:hypothetical protein CYY_001189 [Polysphondylium violaceum]|uniref:Uncharacterized protein n=1 Tax=Polysphondylium violaceum TaxID=133409 RepID=A0A8J4V1U0_9MYCE|nr:hypothetical protein CYY_001189 [Polysphondylium violaceum]
MLVSKSWLLNILPKIKYPVLSIETKQQWQKVVTLILRHEIPLKLTFSMLSLTSYLDTLIYPSLYHRFKQIFSPLSSHYQQINQDQFIDLICPHIDTLRHNYHYLNEVLVTHFKNLIKHLENNNSSSKSKTNIKLRKYRAKVSGRFFSDQQLGIELFTHLELLKFGAGELDEIKRIGNIISKMKSLRNISIDCISSQHKNENVIAMLKILSQNQHIKRLSLKLSLSPSLYLELPAIPILTSLFVQKTISVEGFTIIVNEMKSLLNLFVFVDCKQLFEIENNNNSNSNSNSNISQLNHNDDNNNSKNKIYNTSLKNLSLSGIYFYSDCNFLDLLYLPNLKMFRFDEFPFKFTPKGCPSLETLEMDINPVDMETYFSQSGDYHSETNHYLTKLKKIAIDCKFIHLPPEETSMMPFVLNDNINQLLTMHITNLSFTRMYFTMIELAQLFKLLSSSNKQIREFGITNSNRGYIPPYTTHNFNSMVGALVQNTQFTNLTMSNIGLDKHENTTLLFETMQHLNNLNYLDIGQYVYMPNDKVEQYKSLVKKNINNLLILNFTISDSDDDYKCKFKDPDNVVFLNVNNILTLNDNKISHIA